MESKRVFFVAHMSKGEPSSDEDEVLAKRSRLKLSVGLTFLHVLHLRKCAFNKPQLSKVLKSMSSMSFGQPRSFAMLFANARDAIVCVFLKSPDKYYKPRKWEHFGTGSRIGCAGCASFSAKILTSTPQRIRIGAWHSLPNLWRLRPRTTVMRMTMQVRSNLVLVWRWVILNLPWFL